MRCVALIPIAKHSGSYPEVYTRDALGKPVFLRVYDIVVKSGVFDNVIIVSDSTDIKNICIDKDVPSKFIDQKVETDLDLLSIAAQDIDSELFFMIQGNCIVKRTDIFTKLINTFDSPYGDDVDAVTVVRKIIDNTLAQSPDVVKVVLDMRMQAMLFSRALIPYIKDDTYSISYYQHVPLIALRKQTLLNYLELPQSTLERVEKIEYLRFIENNMKVKVQISNTSAVYINTDSDIEKIKDLQELV